MNKGKKKGKKNEGKKEHQENVGGDGHTHFPDCDRNITGVAYAQPHLFTP